MNSLPLSWSIIDSKKYDSKIIEKWNLRWYALNFVHSSKIQTQIEQLANEKFETIIRGCNSNLRDKLSKNGFNSLQIGMEAVLKTSQNHFNKKSLKKIIERGNRHGIIEEIKFSGENKTKLNEFKKFTSHAQEPQLKNLFQTEFNEDHYLYVFKKFNNEWLGAILISKNSGEKLHTELILRHSKAPIGIMEALVQHVFTEAKNNGWKELSLGEVPFKIESNSFDLRLFSIKNAGKIINFAYNHKGLYNFKNKFQPRWENLYICTSSKVKLKHIIFILFCSNFHKLFTYKLVYSIKKHILLFFNKKFSIFIPKQLDFNKT
jgi:lysylphosphatidylglycerol synthetase-like protein (DUF2156 family)